MLAVSEKIFNVQQSPIFSVNDKDGYMLLSTRKEVVEPGGTYSANGKRTFAPIFDVTFTKIKLKSSLSRSDTLITN